MTQVELDRANYIKTALDKINDVMNKVDDEHIYFADSAKWDDIAWLAFYELDKDFLKLLEKRKHALECEFANI